MTLYEKTTNLVFDAITNLNQQRNSSQLIDKSLDTVLVGSSSKLDSLGLVTFVISVEERIDEIFNRSVALTNFDFFYNSGNESLTVGSLINYITSKIEETNSG
ncbi:MAG: hypothetical protein ABIJ12_06840 [bacterium]